ncbi:hypothetical protein OQA88_9343 [Cercophora sp. LCS_1]
MKLASPLIASFLANVRFAAAEATTLSICAADAFGDLRVCGTYCFTYDNGNCDYLGHLLDCGWPGADKIKNSCACRPDLLQQAEEGLSSCASSRCAKNTVDISQVVNLYRSYCATAGPSAEPTEALTTESGGGKAVTSTVHVTTAPSAKTSVSIATVTDTKILNGGCLHNLCGSCAVRYFRHGNTCPEDRTVVTGFNDNRNLRDIVDHFLEAFPEHRPTTEEIAEMDGIYRPGQRISVTDH